MKESKICPRCKEVYHGYSAISRTDNKTLICSDCGIREALESIGKSPAKQDDFLSKIHSLRQS